MQSIYWQSSRRVTARPGPAGIRYYVPRIPEPVMMKAMKRFFSHLSYSLLIAATLLLGLAPFSPEPHLVEKTRLLLRGELSRPLDIFDLFFHLAPALLLMIKLALDQPWRRSKSRKIADKILGAPAIQRPAAKDLDVEKLPATIVIHGTADTIVPFSCSAVFGERLITGDDDHRLRNSMRVPGNTGHGVRQY